MGRSWERAEGTKARSERLEADLARVRPRCVPRVAGCYSTSHVAGHHNPFSIARTARPDMHPASCFLHHPPYPQNRLSMSDRHLPYFHPACRPSRSPRPLLLSPPSASLPLAPSPLQPPAATSPPATPRRCVRPRPLTPRPPEHRPNVLLFQHSPHAPTITHCVYGARGSLSTVPSAFVHAFRVPQGLRFIG